MIAQMVNNALQHVATTITELVEQYPEYRKMRDVIDGYTAKYVDDLLERNFNLVRERKELTGHHMQKEAKHELHFYEYVVSRSPEFDIEIQYSYCPTCRKVWSKYLVGFCHPISEAYVWEIITHGEKA